MDFVYVCRSGENEELRYSIRSVVKVFPEARIWVVGGKPSWYTGQHIEVEQSRGKYTNVLNNLIAICESEEIPESFIFMNDDFFILRNFDPGKVLHGGYLVDKINKYKEIAETSRYISKLDLTYSRLSKLNIKNILDYELHVPIKIEKKKLKFIINKYPTFLWRSMYGNVYGLGGTEIQDVKVYSGDLYRSRSSEITKDSIFVSTHDQSFGDVYNTLLKNTLPKPSRFEA